MRLHYLQHESFEDPAAILTWAAERGHALSATMLFNQGALPSLDSFDMLVVMGGSMGVYEEHRYPWMAEEKRFIGRAIHGGKAVLGICLGAQLIASALCAAVYKHSHKEIGWHPVHLTGEGAVSPLFRGWPRRFNVFQWHGDTFDLPAGATPVAAGPHCANQAFTYGDRAVALQFHVESTAESVKRIVEQGGEELASGGPHVQTAEHILRQDRHYPRLRELLYRLLEVLEDRCIPNG